MDSDECNEGGQDFFNLMVERMRKDIGIAGIAISNHEVRRHSAAIGSVELQLRTKRNSVRGDGSHSLTSMTLQRSRKMMINWEHKTPFVFTSQGPGRRITGTIAEDDASDCETSDDVSCSLPTPTHDMAPPIAPPRRKTTNMTFRTFRKITSSSSSLSSCHSENNFICDANKERTASPNLQVKTDLTTPEGVLVENEQEEPGTMGNTSTHAGNDINAINNNNVINNNNAINNNNSNVTNNNSISTEDSNRISENKDAKMSVNAALHGQCRNGKNLLSRVFEASPTAVPGEICDNADSRIHAASDMWEKPGAFILHGKDGIENRRRNFSSSSLPLSLMSATIEEVDDTESASVSPSSQNQLAQRSHSYGGTVSPSPRVPIRALRREARVTSMNSPPRTRCPGMRLGLVRSASDNTSSLGCLKDVDIVGESFESRFPWQRDFGVQCEMANDSVFHPNLERALSGPATYTYFRPLSSNSPSSSPPLTARQLALHHNRRSCSHSDLIHQQPALNSSDQFSHFYHRRNIGTATAANIQDVTGRDKASHSKRLANFRGRPRPNSMGAADNIRYQHELSKFRELHNSRRERKSDPQIVQAPSGCRRVALLFSDDLGSASDLESILENPGDRPWDISRQTSLTSTDLEDDVLRYWETSDYPDRVDRGLAYLMRGDVLHSPPISPRLWIASDNEEYIDDTDDELYVSDDQDVGLRRWPRRIKQAKRLSSGSITSDAESESTELDPPVARRGRRPAIYETKNCGDVSPTTLSPEASPSNSCDEGEGASNIAERLRRRRSSVDLAMNIYPGDLLVQEHHKKLIKRNTIADFYAGRQPSIGYFPPNVVGPSPDGLDVNKKGRQPFSLLKLMKTRSKESLTKLDEILKRLKPSEFKDNHLAAYKSLHWSDLIASTDKQQNAQTQSISDTERKRREAVWELFKSECVFLIDHLMVLKHCFMEPLKKVQVEGSLMYAEPQDLFGNLDELSYVSYTFCKDFIAALLKDMSITDFGRTNVLLKAFQRFSAHSRDGAVYHSYCLNYTNALTYLEKLRANSEFSEFEKWCQQDPRCNRLQLTDLLVAPMQHCTKLPLLLHNVRKYTVNEDEREQVTESIQKVETSLKQLEEKMRWIKNFERVQEIQRQIVWPSVAELDPRCVIPESLKLSLSKQPCEKLLACPKRQLLHEGQVTLVETPKALDVHLFLFDDILLITKVKKIQRKIKQLTSDMQASGQFDRASYVVLRQPLALDRIMLHDISSSDAAVSGLKHCFALVHISRYQQITGVFTFQAESDAAKSAWLTQMREAMDGYAKVASFQNGSLKESTDSQTETKDLARSSNRMTDYQFVSQPGRLHEGHSNSLRIVPTKSRSMDAVFI